MNFYASVLSFSDVRLRICRDFAETGVSGWTLNKLFNPTTGSEKKAILNFFGNVKLLLPPGKAQERRSLENHDAFPSSCAE